MIPKIFQNIKPGYWSIVIWLLAFAVSFALTWLWLL